jgi:diaminopimelate decarboxylase
MIDGAMSTPMEPFHYRDGQLCYEEILIAEMAEKFDTPLYVYSPNAILGILDALKTAFAEVDPLICYLVKANSKLGDS